MTGETKERDLSDTKRQDMENAIPRLKEEYKDYLHSAQGQMQQAQEIVNNSREGDQSNHPFVEAQVDMNVKRVKEDIKLLYPGLWQAMYYGKFKLN